MASSTPSSKGTSTGSSSAPRKPTTLSDAVHAVERVLSFRGGAARIDTGSTKNTPPVEGSRSYYGVPNLTGTRITIEELRGDTFPSIGDDRLERLFPSPELAQARRSVRAALEEMEMNFKLDTKSLGNERTETNQGYQAIALLLSKIQVDSGGQDTASVAASGQPSGATVDQDRSGNERADGAAGSSATGSAGLPAPRSYETHDLLKAIDRKDSETILAIRDANFDLLLDLSQGGQTPKTSSAAAQAGGTSNTPLGYSIGLGKGWEGVSIVLVGAISKFINNLPDDEPEAEIQEPVLAPGQGLSSSGKRRKATKVEVDPRTMARLRKIRVNLKLAIDHSLFTDQTRLLASYMQVLVMSEGTPFLYNSIASVQHALFSRTTDPISTARSAVLQFVTDALRHKTDRVAAVKDYVSNATGDMILMALWDLVKLRRSETVESNEDDAVEQDPDLLQPLPLYFFARDDRVTAHFLERVGKLEKLLNLVHASGTRATSGKTGRNAGAWKLARQLLEDLEAGTRRKSADERLTVISERTAK